MKLIPSRKMKLLVELPGPTRNRLPAEYQYEVIHREERPIPSGCVMCWRVTGGRMIYLIALEQVAQGNQRWHCSCADAVYRGDRDPQHQCKHVLALREILPVSG